MVAFWTLVCPVSVIPMVGPHLAVRLATHDFHSVPLFLCGTLLQLRRPEETHSIHVGAVAALRGGHEGRRDQQNLDHGGIKVKNIKTQQQGNYNSQEVKYVDRGLQERTS